MTRRWQVRATSAALCCLPLVHGCGGFGIPASYDFSDFEEFRLERDPGIVGFCVDTGSPVSASIRRGADGTYVAEIELLEGAAPRYNECPEGWVPDEQWGEYCLDVTVSPERVLTAAEVEAVRGVFASVRVEHSMPLLCLFIAGDPCVYETYAWDEHEVGTYGCEAPRLDPAAATEILDLLESLAAQ